MLEVIEMEGQQKKMPVNLSGGMKKRVGLARAIINVPPVFSTTNQPPDWTRLFPTASTI